MSEPENDVQQENTSLVGLSREVHLPRSLHLILAIGASVLAISGVRAWSSALGPLAVALVVVVTVWPIHGWLRAKGLPTAVATVATTLVGIGAIAAMILSLVWAAAELANLVSSESYLRALSDYGNRAADALAELGIDEAAIRDLVSNLDIPNMIGQLSSLMSGLVGTGSLVALIVAGIFFMSADALPFARQVQRLGKERPAVANSLTSFAGRTRSYMAVSTVFGLIVAVLDGLALLVLDIPLALVWALVSFITNYIPNVGFFIGVIPPAILALFEGGPTLMLWVIVIYVVLNFVIQSLIQPRFVGDSVGLSTTLTFISLLFWSYVLGPVGALMAVPLTLLCQALFLDSDPSMAWTSGLISLKDDDDSDAELIEQAKGG